MCTKQQLIKIRNKGNSLMMNFWWERSFSWFEARQGAGDIVTRLMKDLRPLNELEPLPCFTSYLWAVPCSRDGVQAPSSATWAYLECPSRAGSCSMQTGCGHQPRSLGSSSWRCCCPLPARRSLGLLWCCHFRVGFFFPETETLNFFVKLRFNKLFFFNGLELEFASEFPMLYFWCALFPFWGEVLAPHTFIRSWSEWFCVYSEFMFNTHHRPLTNPRKLGKAFSAGVDLAAC